MSNTFRFRSNLREIRNAGPADAGVAFTVPKANAMHSEPAWKREDAECLMPLNHDWVRVARRLDRPPGDADWELKLACEAARIRVRSTAAELKRELARAHQLSCSLQQALYDLSRIARRSREPQIPNEGQKRRRH